MGKNEMRVGAVQATPIIQAATLTVMYVVYLRGLTIAKYRSTAIQHKCKVETVLKCTSRDVHRLQMVVPKFHRPVISTEALKVMAKQATKRSATANDTRK